MKNSYFKIVLTILVIVSTQLLFGQKYADKDYYLIDSLDLSSLSVSDKALIDSILPLYHKSKVDTTKLSLISEISEKCYDDDVWPKYNQFLFDKSQEKLTYPSLSKKERRLIKKILASTINNKGFIAYNFGNNKEAIDFYQFSFKLYQEIHDKDGIAACLNNIGSIYDDEGKTDEALKYYLKSLKFVEQLGDDQGIALALNNIGYIFSDLGQIEKALGYYRRSIKILEKIGDKQVLATTFNNVGYIYKNQANYKMALEYFTKCLKLFEEIEYQEGIAGIYNNIGLIYTQDKSTYDKALEYYKKSLAIQIELGNKKGEAETSNNIGVVYNKKENYSLALEYYSKSLSIREEIGDKSGTAYSLWSISNVKLLQGDFKTAKKLGLRSLQLANELGFPYIIKNAAELMSRIYMQENDPVNELKMYKLYVEMRDSIVNEETKRVVMKHDIQYQFEKQALKDSIATAESQKIKDLKYNQEMKQQKTYTYFGIIGIGLMILVVLVVFRGYQNKRRSNFLLEEKNILIEEKNIEITDSITYAKRIQKAILPSKEELNQHLFQGFVFYQPKDIVAGDFYWLQKVNNEILYAVADCTGHGVPGAMVSVVCHNALNRSVREYNISEPAAILNKTRELVIETFQRSRENNNIIKDGMDIALCSINYKNRTLQYSGANNPLYIVRDGKLLETRADKQPVGKHYKNNLFTNHAVRLEKNDLIYTFSDGYADQFGGPKGKKFMYRQFKQLLVSLSNKDIEEQKNILFETFKSWKGNLEQIDDVCVIGVKI